MTRIIFYNALIQAIEKLYCRLTLRRLHRQMNSYHKQSSYRMKSYAIDIKSPLLECVNGICDNPADNPESPHILDYSILTNTTAKPNITEEHM